MFFVAMSTAIDNEKCNCVACQLSTFADSDEKVKSIPLPFNGWDTLNVDYSGLSPKFQ